MRKIIRKIRIPISKEMNFFEEMFYEYMQSETNFLDQITHYMFHKQGKQIRPMFVFLIAKMLGNPVEKTYHAAVIIELIHTATLVHDDVIDNSNMRRNFFSINSLWNNKISVLVGDYLFTKSILLATKKKYLDLLNIISQTVKKIIEGEILQLETSKKFNFNENIYEEIIKNKTGSLISACCEAGALSIGADKHTCIQMKYFGEITGSAFQIKDDLFDYEQNTFIGKPTGFDIKEKNLTLPLIYVIKNSNLKTQKWIINSIKNHNKDKKRIQEVISFVYNNGGLDYAIKKMNKLRKKALEILKKYPENSSKKALNLMVNYIVERNI